MVIPAREDQTRLFDLECDIAEKAARAAVFPHIAAFAIQSQEPESRR
jgi:hypothetical protein